MASEQEIIRSIQKAEQAEIKVRIIDQLGHKIKPQHRELIRYLVDLSASAKEDEIAYSVKRALFQIRSRYNITNFSLFLMDPVTLLQSSDPAYRIKALEVFENGKVSLEQCYYFLGSVNFEDDPFVLSRMIRVLPQLSSHLPVEKIEELLTRFLEHKNAKIRSSAMESLSLVKEQQGKGRLDILFHCLMDQDQRVRDNSILKLKTEDRDILESRFSDRLQNSTNYFEIQSILQIVDELGLKIDTILLNQARKNLKFLEIEAQKQTLPTPAIEAVEIGLQTPKTKAEISLLGRPLSFWLAGCFGLSVFLVIILSAHNKKLQSQNQLLAGKIQHTAPVSVAKESTTTELLANQKMDLDRKVMQFQQDGEILRKNAELFLNMANLSFEEENYTQAVKLYMTLYEVYKDNRLAVDAVRYVSKTQKIQNVLESVQEYMSKKQYISAQKKLEEIKHLLSAENFQKHYNEVEKAKTSYQAHFGRKKQKHLPQFSL